MLRGGAGAGNRYKAMSKLKLPVLGLMSLLGACAHVGIQEVGHGQCSVSGISSSGGYHGSREEAIESANEYCGRFGKAGRSMAFSDEADVDAHGERMSSVTFHRVPSQPLEFCGSGPRRQRRQTPLPQAAGSR